MRFDVGIDTYKRKYKQNAGTWALICSAFVYALYPKGTLLWNSILPWLP